MNIPADLLVRALELPEEQRSELARRLIVSLESADPVDGNPDYEEAWVAEIEERIARSQSGASRAIPVGEVISRLRTRRQGTDRP